MNLRANSLITNNNYNNRRQYPTGMLKVSTHLTSVQTRKQTEHAGKNRPFFDNEYFKESSRGIKHGLAMTSKFKLSEAMNINSSIITHNKEGL